jgi:hypothetical protein
MLGWFLLRHSGRRTAATSCCCHAPLDSPSQWDRVESIALRQAYEKGGALRWDDPAVLRVTVGSVRTACTPVDEADVFQGW